MNRTDMNITKAPGRQAGFASLMLTLSLLFGVTIVTLTTAKSILMEQRMSGNELRTEQAFEASEAGLDRALDYLTNGGLDQDGATGTDTLATTTQINGSRYTVDFCKSTVAASADGSPCDNIDANRSDVDDSDVLVYSQGWSGDGVAHQHLVQLMNKGPALADPPNVPLTTKGSCVINGSGDITNPEGNATIWSGHAVTVTNANFKTNIPHPNPDPSASCYSQSLGCLIESSNVAYIGLDVIDQDSNLSTLTGDLYFKNFFGKLPTDYKNDHVSLELTAANASNADGVNKEVIWIDGDTTFTGNIAIGAQPDLPSIVIIDGNLSGAGNVTINGLLYITGNFTATGNYTVYGAVIVEGNSAATGSLDIIFDSALLAHANYTGKMSVVAGTWRDWI